MNVETGTNAAHWSVHFMEAYILTENGSVMKGSQQDC